MNECATIMSVKNTVSSSLCNSPCETLKKGLVCKKISKNGQLRMDFIMSAALVLSITQYVLQLCQGSLKFFKSLHRTARNLLFLHLNVETQLSSLSDLFLNSFWFMAFLNFKHIYYKNEEKSTITKDVNLHFDK